MTRARGSSWRGCVNTDRCSRNSFEMELLQNSISVPAARANHGRKGSYRVKLLKKSKQRVLIAKGVLGCSQTN